MICETGEVNGQKQSEGGGDEGGVATIWFVFFFQAEDGIRYLTVTGGQTCALPIWISFRATFWTGSSFLRRRPSSSGGWKRSDSPCAAARQRVPGRWRTGIEWPGIGPTRRR